ncbi:MAG: MFS transporter [Gammaproteobacteria bacterium]
MLIASLIVAESVAIFEGSMLYSTLATFYRLFGDPIAVGWILTAYLLASASSALILARLGDMFGRRRIILVVLIVGLAGSVVSGLSSTVMGIVAGRALQGLHSSVLPLSYGLMRQHLTREQATLGVGLFATVMTVGGGVGLFIGGVIVDHLSWQWIFVFSSALAIVAFFLVRKYVPAEHPAGEPEPVDVAGAIMLASGICAVLYAIGSSKHWGWADGRALALILAGLGILALFVRRELRIDQPLVDVRLLRRRQTALANLGMMVIGLGPLQAQPFLALLLQQPPWTGAGLGLSAAYAGSLLFLPMTTALVGGPLAAWLTRRISARFVLGLSGLTIFVAWGVMAIHHGSLWLIMSMMLGAAMAQAMASAAVPMLILDDTPPGRTSEATAVITTLRPAAMGTGTQISSLILATTMVSNPAMGPGQYPAESAFTLLLAFVAGTGLLCLGCAWALPARAHTAGRAPD